MVTITLYARQQKRHRCIKQSFGLCGEGEGGMIWENGIEMCILSHVKRIASPGSMHETRCSGQGAPQIRCTGMTLSDAMGRQVGRGFSIGNTHG